MAEFPHSDIRQFVGKGVRVALAGGRVVDGHLLSFDGRSLWLVTNGEDHFVPLSQVDLVTPWPVQIPLAG